MNLVAHIEVAARVRLDAVAGDGAAPPVLVGSALPDIASMGRYRLVRPGPGELGDGIRAHHLADVVFHADPRVRALMARLRDRLMVAGVARGPARACGHVGVELLLDGVLVGGPDVAGRTAAVLTSLGDPDDEVIAAVRPGRRAPWRDHLRRVADRLQPRIYREPELVAGLLHRILAGRPPLDLRVEDGPAVTAGLRAVHDDVAEVAAAVVDDTTAALS